MLAAYQRTGSGSGSCKEKHDRDNGNDVGARARQVRSRFSIGLAGILVFRGLLVIRLGLATARLVIRLRFPKLQTVQCRVKERGGIGDKTVLFAAERGVVPQREGPLVRFRERCDRIVRVFAEFGKLGLCRRDQSFERALSSSVGSSYMA